MNFIIKAQDFFKEQITKPDNKSRKIIYDKIDMLKKQKVKSPFCFIIPGELHFLEKEALKDI